MGLITKEVEVCIANNNYKYYENLEIIHSRPSEKEIINKKMLKKE